MSEAIIQNTSFVNIDEPPKNVSSVSISVNAEENRGYQSFTLTFTNATYNASTKTITMSGSTSAKSNEGTYWNGTLNGTIRLA